MTQPTVKSPTQTMARAPTRVWCAPPHSQDDTRAKRIVDRLLPSGLWRCPFFVAIAIAIGAEAHLSVVPGLALGIVATFAASAYCLLNFWRCREAHCIVSGAGWAALVALEVAEIAVRRSFIHGDEGLAFVVILVLAIAFEVFWRMRYGTNVVMRETPHP